VSLMCDRKLRVAFVQGPQGWRFARGRIGLRVVAPYKVRL
jgi:hypothetical protein